MTDTKVFTEEKVLSNSALRNIPDSMALNEGTQNLLHNLC